MTLFLPLSKLSTGMVYFAVINQNLWTPAQIARFMGPTWGPPGSCRPQVGPMLAPHLAIREITWYIDSVWPCTCWINLFTLNMYLHIFAYISLLLIKLAQVVKRHLIKYQTRVVMHNEAQNYFSVNSLAVRAYITSEKILYLDVSVLLYKYIYICWLTTYMIIRNT